jgi:hypothetical protein
MKQYVGFVFLLLPLVGLTQIEMVAGDEGILFTEKGREVIFYQIEPKSHNGAYTRCNYFHPLWSLDGQVITEDFPDDHLHHRGIFWAWHQVIVDGHDAGDLWELKGIRQEVNEVEFLSLPAGAGLFKTETIWSAIDGASKGIPGPFLQENVSVTIHPRKTAWRRIDFRITLMALKDKVQLGGSADDKGYGGFSVRLKLPPDAVFKGIDGPVVPMVTPVIAPGWINITGQPFPGRKRFGLTILDNPENPGYPQPWILRKERSMQNAVFPGRKPITLTRGNTVVLNYTLLVHNGKLKNRLIMKESGQ